MQFRVIAALGCFVMNGALVAGGSAGTTLHEATADGRGTSFGHVRFVDTEHGLLVIPQLEGLEAGPHAAHVHEIPACGPGPDGNPAGAAGGHFDPEGSGVHAGPYGDGHLGDLPNLWVETDGRARIPVLAPRVRAEDLRGRALMLHAGADRYDAHGGHAHGKGGPRMYCGVIR